MHVSTDDVLDLTEVVLERVDIVEFWETRESSEPRRTTCGAEGLLGGRLGDGCCEFLRVGNGGGPFRLGSGRDCLVRSRSMGGGGRMPLDLALAGSLLFCLTNEEPNDVIGGLLTVLLLASSCGRCPSGLGGGGRLAVVDAPLLSLACDCFSAAIRSDSEINCGSSTSAILKNATNRSGELLERLSDLVLVRNRTAFLAFKHQVPVNCAAEQL